MNERPIQHLNWQHGDSGYQKHGEDVARRAIDIIKATAPEVYRVVEDEAAIFVNIFGPDLECWQEWIGKYSRFGQVLKCVGWHHPQAGGVVTFVVKTTPDYTPRQVIEMIAAQDQTRH